MRRKFDFNLTEISINIIVETETVLYSHIIFLYFKFGEEKFMKNKIFFFGLCATFAAICFQSTAMTNVNALDHETNTQNITAAPTHTSTISSRQDTPTLYEDIFWGTLMACLLYNAHRQVAEARRIGTATV